MLLSYVHKEIIEVYQWPSSYEIGTNRFSCSLRRFLAVPCFHSPFPNYFCLKNTQNTCKKRIHYKLQKAIACPCVATVDLPSSVNVLALHSKHGALL